MRREGEGVLRSVFEEAARTRQRQSAPSPPFPSSCSAVPPYQGIQSKQQHETAIALSSLSLWDVEA